MSKRGTFSLTNKLKKICLKNKDDIQEKAILYLVDSGLIKESEIDENFLQKIGFLPSKEVDQF